MALLFSKRGFDRFQDGSAIGDVDCEEVSRQAGGIVRLFELKQGCIDYVRRVYRLATAQAKMNGHEFDPADEYDVPIPKDLRVPGVLYDPTDQCYVRGDIDCEHISLEKDSEGNFLIDNMWASFSPVGLEREYGRNPKTHTRYDGLSVEHSTPVEDELIAKFAHMERLSTEISRSIDDGLSFERD